MSDCPCLLLGRIEQEQPKGSAQQSPTHGQARNPSEARDEKRVAEVKVEKESSSVAQSKTGQALRVREDDGGRLVGTGCADRDVANSPCLSAPSAAEAEEAGLEANDGEKEVRDEDVKQLYDDEAQMCSMPECPDPRLFVEGLALRRYQRQALAWMMERERRRYVTEEDCTGLSLVSDQKEGGAAGSSSSGHGSVAPGDIEHGEAVGIKDGVVYVTSWDAAGENAGGRDGAVIHPLWERRAAASMVRTSSEKAPPSSASSLFLGAAGESGRGGEDAAGRSLSRPEAFFVNVYSRHFQREFPPASLGCRGGILADEMGMGKVRACFGGAEDRGSGCVMSGFGTLCDFPCGTLAFLRLRAPFQVRRYCFDRCGVGSPEASAAFGGNYPVVGFSPFCFVYPSG